jgi:hypothetical protein
MSQQINLLTRERKPVGAALAALAVVAVVLLGLLAYDAMLRAETARLVQNADSGQRQLNQAKAAMQALRQRAESNNDAANLKAEIDALRSKADAIRQWEQLINSGTLGSPQGYAQYLSTLASVPEEGLWITSFSVGNTGKLVSLSGRALRNESVLRYAGRLNEAFAPQGVQFNSVEMTPENLVKSAEPGKPVLSTVAFKLF